MARIEAVQEGRRRRRAANEITRVDQSTRVAQALRLLARNADRMHFAPDDAAFERCRPRNGRIWRTVTRLGINEEVLAGLRARHGKLPPAVRNWRRARLANATSN